MWVPSSFYFDYYWTFSFNIPVGNCFSTLTSSVIAALTAFIAIFFVIVGLDLMATLICETLHLMLKDHSNPHKTWLGFMHLTVKQNILQTRTQHTSHFNRSNSCEGFYIESDKNVLLQFISHFVSRRKLLVGYLGKRGRSIYYSHVLAVQLETGSGIW